jgi:hypothetical protein
MARRLAAAINSVHEISGLRSMLKMIDADWQIETYLQK